MTSNLMEYHLIFDVQYGFYSEFKNKQFYFKVNYYLQDRIQLTKGSVFGLFSFEFLLKTSLEELKIDKIGAFPYVEDINMLCSNHLHSS